MTNVVPQISFIDFVFDSSVVSFGLGTKSFLICTRRDLGKLVISVTSLAVPTILVMVCFSTIVVAESCNCYMLNQILLTFILIVDTHLIFPHDSTLSIVYKILQYVLILSEGSLSRSNAYSTLRVVTKSGFFVLHFHVCVCVFVAEIGAEVTDDMSTIFSGHRALCCL
ncbi:LOW QUALITY PROTEIN: hypothetical protein HID58_046952, partial [Brassica napus]